MSNDITWDEEIIWDAPRRATSAAGLATEAAKGASRGATALPNAVARSVAPIQSAIPQDMRLRGDPAAGSLWQKLLEQLKPSPQASVPEQMLGTGAEIATSAAPFAKGSALKRIVETVLPAVGGATGEQVAGDTGKLIGSVAGGLVGPRGAAASTTDKPIKELHKEGYLFLPSQAKSGVVSRTVEGLSGSPRIAGAMEIKNQEVTQNLTAKALGLPKGTVITEDVLEQHAKQHLNTGYEPIKQIQNVGIGKTFRDELRDIANKLGASGKDFPAAKRQQVQKLVNQYMYDDKGRFLQRYSGAGALEEIKLLRKEAAQNFKPGGDALLGEAQRRVATALEDNIERSLPKGSQLLSDFRNARKELAKNFAVDRMLVDKTSGIVDPRKAHSMAMAGEPLSDGLDIIAKAGSPLYSKTTKPPIGGSPPPISVPEGFFAGGMTASIPFSGPVGAGLAAIPLARAGGRAALQTKPVQNSMLRDYVGPAAGMYPPLFSMGEQ